MILPTHCPWPTSGDFAEFAACWVLSGALQPEWSDGPPSKTFDLSAPNPLRRAWALTHVSEMPEFHLAIQRFSEGIAQGNELKLILILNSYTPAFPMWDSLYKEYQTNPRAILREGEAIKRYLTRNDLPFPTVLNSIPERPDVAKLR